MGGMMIEVTVALIIPKKKVVTMYGKVHLMQFANAQNRVIIELHLSSLLPPHWTISEEVKRIQMYPHVMYE